ncbi:MULTISPECIES: alpha/beta fold hydrolase [unclassified Arthrobacter]|uniref:alpha/beta fold hydrolase n=1 Tax=unclassified Arthrobacter TaxID=235627 RepID=UPI001D1465FD|nr:MULTISPECIES: alpha/beta fold hydrolase [unclassified Arthrobacter]MCC3275084.1 alpha/beta hydrolase [Arthrobacter sp. zg-Y20]MCC9177321.1 alpha/beta hydrolase [Arthrobacter sp. zg-Y750]MDK1315241.1 alpha/beta fold hydrolase [Arthrobacter sp. zg.Y20]WIB05075.1 alpha/beta fold hydrolase [Arthrobacter sp. zg-Y20]
MLRQRVVFVHGAGSFGAAAWPKQHGLALDYDALFLRRHGYGAAAGPVPPDLEADIALIRGELGEGGHLVAHSTGAVPAMLAALRYPGKVFSLVLCEPAVFSLTRDLPVTTAHRALLQPHSDAAPEWDAPLDIVPGVPTLVLTGGWEPLYEEVAEFLVSTGAEHLQVGGNHRPQDTDAGARAIRAFLARRKRDS